MSTNQKNEQFNGVSQIDINTSSQQTDEAVPMDEEKPEKKTANINNVSQGSILTTMSSEESLNQKEPLNICNNIILSSSEEKEDKASSNKEYLNEVYENLLLEENNFYQKINSDYMSFQNSINDKMRAILVDWLIDVHFRLDMKKKTLFNCIYIIDAYLSKNLILKKDFQLLGVAALLIACKESEIIYPPLQTFIAFSDYSFTVKDLIDMEGKIIKELEFNILAPTAEEFFGINAEYFELTDEQRFFGEYFLDISLIDYHSLKYKQSTIAVACGYITMKFFKLNAVHLILDNLSEDVTQKEVKNCARDLCFFMRNISNSSLVSTKNKYLSEKYLKVAKYCEDK